MLDHKNMSIIIDMDAIKQPIPGVYLTSKQKKRIYELQTACVKAVNSGNPIIHVQVRDDEFPIVIAIVINFLDDHGLNANLTTKLITEYDAYYCHDYQCVKTFLAIIPRTTMTDRFLPNTDAHNALVNMHHHNSKL